MTPSELSWPLRTERLLLRPAEPRDAAATFAFRTRPEVARWLTSWPRDLAAWEAGYAERLADTLVVERDGAVVGDLMLRVEDAWAQAEVRTQAAGTQAEVGYVLDPAHAGVGYATEAVRRLMERLGMRREQHTVRDSLHRSGEWLDGYGYALLREEWLSAR